MPSKYIIGSIRNWVIYIFRNQKAKNLNLDPRVRIKLDFTPVGLGFNITIQRNSKHIFLQSHSLVSHLKLHFTPFVKVGAGPKSGGKLTWHRGQHSVSYKPINLPNMWQFYQLSARQIFFQISRSHDYMRMKFAKLFWVKIKHLSLDF